MTQNIASLSQCANCGACLNSCPVNAITVDKDSLFYQPTVDLSACIRCGKCVAVCPLEAPLPVSSVKSAWWGRHRDPDIVKSSSSGGAFTALAQQILSAGGIVFGACFDQDNMVILSSTDEVSLSQLKKSKYVESLAGGSFREAEKHLHSGRKVLFCATPCQIAGLKNDLGRDYENLYTCDFSCGGLPSHALYRNHLNALEKKYRAPITSVDFRPKVYGWSTYAIRVEFANGKQYVNSASLDPFYCGFIAKHVNCREYCYDCRFADSHVSDMTLADFWRYSQFLGGKLPQDGISLILANTDKGNMLLQQVRESLNLQPLDIDAASYNLKKRHSDAAHMALRQTYLTCAQHEGLLQAKKLIAPRGFQALRTRAKHFLKGIKYKNQ